jgi:hypothetical protein
MIVHRETDELTAKGVGYERPRLAAITVKGDVDNPPRVQLDLTVSTDAELDTMEKLCLKAGAGHTGGDRPESPHDNFPSHEGRQLVADPVPDGIVV